MRLITRRSLFAAAGLSAACRKGGNGRIAIISRTTGTTYWENLHAGALSTAKGFGYRIFWNGPQAENQYAEQVLALEDVIGQRYDAIILAPSHGSVLASAVRHARSEGIPLVLVDSPAAVHADEYVAYIGSNEERVGRVAAQRIGDVVDGPAEVALLGVSPTIEPAVKRERAFSRAISRDFPRIRIADVRYGLSDYIRSRELVLDLLSRRPAIKALFASDSFGARGALAALRQPKSRRVRLVAVGQEGDMIEPLAQGLIDSLVVQDPYSMGQHAVRILHDVLEGSYTGPRIVETEVALATAVNLDDPNIRRLLADRRQIG